MIQVSGGIALAGMAGCLGSSDEPNQGDTTNDKTTDESSKDTNQSEKKNTGLSTGDKAPKSEVETPDGKTVTLKAEEKPTAVLFTEITSKRAKAHSETLADLYEEYEEEIKLITVNTDLDASKDDLREFHEEYGGDWDHAMGTTEVLEEYGIDTGMALCIIDSDGKLALRFDGEITASAIEDAIKAYIDD